MPIDHDGLRQVLDAFEEGEWDEIHLVTGEVEVHLVARGSSPSVPDTSHVLIKPRDVAALSPASAVDAADVPSISPAAAEPEAGTELVVAPSPGIFWRAPSPGAPPFTDVGMWVEPGTALCIVEVMKLMNTLPAPVSGTVVEVYAQNGEQVETGRPLFRIRPEGQ
ncbi:acetyl-CoA carboxylase biotin carboxyl carrier protein [Pseudonocardia acidicola]|uniref:Biotin carboxyl carrier protein of acetyl-CoA carboxylase n=1 Tax=Pseudonocardia acidicola TaxID=2724939 RepID=A0ABX1SAM4_9PSEU|nr:biotin/lipoyl-containing protein [Pseudonocardia acidicola]NMH98620.1 acetyl-CoA carboxylase, biotin carboxyl carrier protein [Pseudonocardia acidicola]